MNLVLARPMFGVCDVQILRALARPYTCLKLSLSLYQSQCPHIALINSQLQNNFTNFGPLKLQSKWFKYY